MPRLATAPSRTLVFSIVVPLISVLLCLGALEVAIRLAIYSDAFAIDKLRQPRHYADPWLDDDYQKLEYLFDHSQRSSGGRGPGQTPLEIHPQLGWAPKITVDNPLGIVTDRLVEIDELQPAVLFFGDSYVDGPEPIPNKLPQLLDPLLASHSVVNYGVSGYGVDQIFLRFLDSYKKYQDPIVLIGIQDRDIDRTIMSIRNQQKPVLDIQNGELVITNTPIGATAEFIRRNPVELKSYLGRFVLMRLRRLGLERPIDRLLGYDKRHEQKLRVNRRILQALHEEAEQAGIRLYAVLFYVENDMLVEDWRERFLKTTLDELQIPYFDTKTYLYDVLAVEGGSVKDYWSDEHGHPNLGGNRVFARGIATWLAARDANGVVLN